MFHIQSSPILQCQHSLVITHLKENIETQTAKRLKIRYFSFRTFYQIISSLLILCQNYRDETWWMHSSYQVFQEGHFSNYPYQGWIVTMWAPKLEQIFLNRSGPWEPRHLQISVNVRQVLPASLNFKVSGSYRSCLTQLAGLILPLWASSPSISCCCHTEPLIWEWKLWSISSLLKDYQSSLCSNYGLHIPGKASQRAKFPLASAPNISVHQGSVLMARDVLSADYATDTCTTCTVWE